MFRTSLRATLVVPVAVAMAAGASCTAPTTSPPRQLDVMPDQSSRRDAGAKDGAAIVEPDAQTAPVLEGECDPDKPFAAPTELFDNDVRGVAPRLSGDELTLYFSAPGPNGDRELFRANRGMREDTFGTPFPMTAQNSTFFDYDPSVSDDHLTLFFASTRTGARDLYTASRASTAVDFGAPTLVPNVNDPASRDTSAYYRTAGGGELWLATARGSTFERIHRARKAGAGFEAPELVAELVGGRNDILPMVTEDGLTMVLSSDRDGGAGMHDLYIAERDSTSDRWQPPRAISELNTPTAQFAGWISADRCRLYYSSTRIENGANVDELFVARRPR